MTKITHSNLHIHDEIPPADDFLQEVVIGLSGVPKRIPPRFLWDKRGMELFKRICETEEYYIFRTEKTILHTYRDEIALSIGSNATIIELGSGDCEKIRYIIDKIKPRAYVAFDISFDDLVQNTTNLATEFPWLDVHAVWGDYTKQLNLDFGPEDSRRVVYFGGSTIGNFEPDEAVDFLHSVRKQLRRGGALLVGVDLKKDSDVLHRAFNDSKGVTASFNLNLLDRLERELGAQLDRDGFEHHAFFNQRRGRLEAHIRSLKDQEISLAAQVFPIKKGEIIHTENSYKYSVSEFRSLASRAGYRPSTVWQDRDKLFSLHFLTATSLEMSSAPLHPISPAS